MVLSTGIIYIDICQYLNSNIYIIFHNFEEKQLTPLFLGLQLIKIKKYNLDHRKNKSDHLIWKSAVTTKNTYIVFSTLKLTIVIL